MDTITDQLADALRAMYDSRPKGDLRFSGSCMQAVRALAAYEAICAAPITKAQAEALIDYSSQRLALEGSGLGAILSSMGLGELALRVGNLEREEGRAAQARMDREAALVAHLPANSFEAMLSDAHADDPESQALCSKWQEAKSAASSAREPVELLIDAACAMYRPSHYRVDGRMTFTQGADLARWVLRCFGAEGGAA